MRDIDKALLLAMISIILFGILNIYMATKGSTTPYYFVKKQFIWFCVSMVVIYFLLAIDYRVVYRYVPVFYWFSVILLILVWVPGIGITVNGARGWINLGVMKLQPAEVAKFGIILMLAKQLDDIDCEVNNIKNLIRIGIYFMIPVGLILIQPDMGMSMVCFFIALGMIFIAGLDKRIIYGGFVSLLVVVVILWNSGLILPHQKARILTFVSSDTEDSGNGYQLSQSLIGIGSGGLTGSNKPTLDPTVSPGYAGTHVPEIQTDFIFAAIAEQWGLLGAMFLLTLYGILIVRMVVTAKTTKDRFGSLVCIGMVSYFLFAITQNIGMTIGLVPITGITLPLVSYGGSSLLTTSVAVALVLNIGMRKRKIHF
ncbi:MAG: rod shape-determining protein RodA [Clostridium sp.]|uniref:rod shape-determining protein RodA n=1 Tax=Clostridium sp. DSM 8431 TaxID=1761781 RepID=UPI0008F1934E|nr:rod shape-determining protein RodA [Clostridium sp. DSM 8431]MCR4943404.1 rod shape-determining protein RodA [Clostridium sp.]SFU66996.1 rod shape determining protein RodA [Clostridium sp. DSM 8431]